MSPEFASAGGLYPWLYSDPSWRGPRGVSFRGFEFGPDLYSAPRPPLFELDFYLAPRIPIYLPYYFPLSLLTHRPARDAVGPDMGEFWPLHCQISAPLTSFNSLRHSYPYPTMYYACCLGYLSDWVFREGSPEDHPLLVSLAFAAEPMLYHPGLAVKHPKVFPGLAVKFSAASTGVHAGSVFWSESGV